MNARERREKIIEFINELEKVDIDFLKSKFNVSEMTIYRDLQRLESQGYLKKII
jgi:DeoR/GlpR family transcriptional regulator of sugar metabolism